MNKNQEADIYQQRYLEYQNRKKKGLIKNEKIEYIPDDICAILNVLINRKSVRKFNGNKISYKKFEKIMRAAFVAPSSCNRKAVKVWPVTEDLQRLSELLVGGRGWIQEADIALMLFADMRAYKSPAEVDFMPFLDAGFIAENIYLMCEVLNVGACFVNPNVKKENQKEFDELFGKEYCKFCGTMILGEYD